MHHQYYKQLLLSTFQKIIFAERRFIFLISFVRLTRSTLSQMKFSCQLNLSQISLPKPEKVYKTVYLLQGNVISTPTIHGTVLPGITRKSIIDIARDFGYQVISALQS